MELLGAEQMINNLILSTRQQGKTRKLIEHCHKDKYSIIVCPNREMCRQTYRIADELNMPIPMPITFDEFVNHEYCEKWINNFYFDELQMSLQNYARGVNIADVIFDVSNTAVKLLTGEKNE